MSADETTRASRKRDGDKPFPSGLHRTFDLLVPASSEPRAVALYERCETGGAAAAGLEALRAQCRRRGLRVAEEFLEAHPIAPGSERPALEALLAELRAGRVHVVAARRLDLLAQTPRELAAFAHELEDRGLDLLVLEPSIDTSTDAGRAPVVRCGRGGQQCDPTPRLPLRKGGGLPTVAR